MNHIIMTESYSEKLALMVGLKYGTVGDCFRYPKLRDRAVPFGQVKFGDFMHACACDKNINR